MYTQFDSYHQNSKDGEEVQFVILFDKNFDSWKSSGLTLNLSKESFVIILTAPSAAKR